MVVIFGLMGVGKTTLAQALAKARDWPVISSDRVRKDLAGLSPTTPARFEFGQGIYREDFSRQTYREIGFRTKELLNAEAAAVILDASFKSARERAQIRDLARAMGAQVVFVLCSCPQEVLRVRLTHRMNNATAVSDGRLELLDLQVEDFEPVTEADQPLLRLNTGQELGEVLREVEGFLDGLSVEK